MSFDEQNTAPKAAVAGGGHSRDNDNDNERESKRPRPAAAALTQGPPLRLILEHLRKNAREARIAARRANELAPSDPGHPWHRLHGEEDEDGERGAIAGNGWWRGPDIFERQKDGSLRRTTVTDGRPPAAFPVNDRLLFETCAAVATVCREWRALAFGAADRAVISFDGYEVDSLASGDPDAWVASPLDDRSKPLDPVKTLRAFDGGVLRALVVRGEPPASAARETRCLARSFNNGSERGVVRVLQGLRVLRLERASALLRVLTPLRWTLPRGQPPLFQALATLDGEFWPESAPVAFTRASFPSLRILRLGIMKREVPFDLWGGGSDLEAPAELTHLQVDSARDQYEEPETVSDGSRELLMVTARTLRALAPTLGRLCVGMSVVGGERMSRLLAPLGSLSRLTSLYIEADHDWTPPAGGGSRWVAASRSLLARLPALQTLELRQECFEVRDEDGLSLPPSFSLLTALTSLEVQFQNIKTVGGGLRRLTGLRRLVLEPACYALEDQHPRHAPILGRDLAALTSLEHLELYYAARCHASAVDSALPRLTALVMCHYPKPVAVAARGRLARGGFAMLCPDFSNGRFVHTPVTLSELDEWIGQMPDGLLHEADSDVDAEDIPDLEEFLEAMHDQSHRRLTAEVERLERLDAAGS